MLLLRLRRRDGTVSLGKMSFDRQWVGVRDKSVLSPDELGVAKEWEAKYQEKYPVVGKLLA